MSSESAGRPIIAVCGKGGVGKTALCALLARALIERSSGAVLLIDADPVCGLVSALGLQGVPTLAGVRSQLIASARDSSQDDRQRIADQLDYLVMQALVERDGFALLAMGNTQSKGCFCAVNSLLRDAIDVVVSPFAAVVIDGEAGIEQVNRQVTRSVTRVLVVTDGSRRSLETLHLITERVPPESVSVVAARSSAPAADLLPRGVEVVGTVPEDATLRAVDRDGRSLLDLPADSPAVVAARVLASRLVPVEEGV